MSIKRRITFAFGILVATLLLLFSIFIYQNYESYRKNLMRNRLQRRALAGQLFFENRMEFHRSTFLTLPDQHESIVNEKNERIYHSSGPDDYPLTSGLLKKTRDGEVVFFQYNAPPWSMPKEGLALSFKYEGKQYISVVTAYDLTGRQANENLFFILASGNIILLLVVAFSAFWFAQRALQPFDKLISQMNPVTANDFSFRLVTGTSQDEAGYLAKSFNELLSSLQSLAISQEHFVSYASHEIRTPLTVVKGVLETSLAYDKSLKDTRQSIEKALVRLEGAINLANSLLHLAEVEGLQTGQLKGDINIVDIVLDTITYFGEKHPLQQIQLHLTDNFTKNASAIKTIGNSTLIRTVLINILENAAKYSQNAPIELIVDFGQEKSEIRVIDKGIGIPVNQLSDIFLPMMRAANVAGLPGYGLGLTIAKKIIDMHQGQLVVSSVQNQGTSVSIFLPAKSFS